MTLEQTFTQIAQSLGRIADVLERQATSGSDSNSVQSEPQTDLTPQDAPQTANGQPETPAEASRIVTLEDARNALMALTKALNDGNATSKAILAEFGANKMSDLKESDYAAVEAKAQAKIEEAAQ